MENRKENEEMEPEEHGAAVQDTNDNEASRGECIKESEIAFLSPTIANKPETTKPATLAKKTLPGVRLGRDIRTCR